MPKRVFISHSSFKPEEKVFIDSLIGALEQKFDVLVDQTHLQPGAAWRDEIYSWMGLCQAAVIVLSESAKRPDSVWVPRECMVLRWRHQLDSRVTVIPIYLPGFTRGDLDQNPFRDLGLTDLQAGVVAAWSDSAAVIEDVSRTLQASIDAPSVLESTALVIAEYLNGTSQSALQEALLSVPLALHGWEKYLSVETQLAVSLTHYGLGTDEQLRQPAMEAIQVLLRHAAFRRPDDWKGLVELLACTWVDLCTARYFTRLAPEQKRHVLVLNASEPETASHYVRRAWAVDKTSPSWKVERILPGAGEDEESVDLEQQVISICLRYLPPGSSRNPRERVENLLRNRAREGRRVFFSVTPENRLSIPQIAACQNKLQAVTFVYLCGEQWPPGLEDPDVALVRPELPSGREETAFQDYDSAYARISGI